MTLIIDAAPMVAAADRKDPLGPTVARMLRDEAGELVIPAPVTAEVDYLLGRRLGRSARLAFLDDLAGGRFRVACLEVDDHGVVATLERRYADLDAGLADLSVVVAAAKFSTHRLLTFDERHFRALRPLDGGRFTVLPSDEPAR
ncbi:MAG TPA: PIN domain-containing protein [Acidimicrobiales bacterium]|nr:PIN domain-containing protein [Acidimicrobiales bacterium]